MLVERIWKDRSQECVCLRLAEAKDGKAWETAEILGDGSSTEQDRNLFCPQSTRSDGKGLRRLPIEPLRIVNDAQDGILRGQLGQQAKESEAHEQSVGRRAGKMAERHTKSVSVRRRQLLKGGQTRDAQLLGRSKREFPFGFVPDSAEHMKTCSGINGVIQQGGLADAGLPRDHHCAPVTGACCTQHLIEFLALVSSP